MGNIAPGSSQLGWVDFSSDDRDRVKQALDMLTVPGTLDELGIGALRDGFADLMFPGFSTLQTRAKYFITVPRIIRDYLQLAPARQRRVSLTDYLHAQEVELADVLRKRHEGQRGAGISGFTLEPGQSVARHPSSIYWVGLRTWGLVAAKGSLNQFLRALELPEGTQGSTLADEPDDHDAVPGVGPVCLDRIWPAWRDDVRIELNQSEAHFLSEKFKLGPPYSLPAQLERLGLRKQALKHGDGGFAALAAWVAGRRELARETRDAVRMAQAFSELIEGAHLRFNILLVRNKRPDLLSSFEQQWQDWRARVRPDPDAVSQWLTLTGARLSPGTELFLRNWSAALLAESSSAQLDDLVDRQARDNKLERSALNKPLPSGFEWLGIRALDYRWWQVRTILRDLQECTPC